MFQVLTSKKKKNKLKPPAAIQFRKIHGKDQGENLLQIFSFLPFHFSLLIRGNPPDREPRLKLGTSGLLPEGTTLELHPRGSSLQYYYSS